MRSAPLRPATLLSFLCALLLLPAAPGAAATPTLLPTRADSAEATLHHLPLAARIVGPAGEPAPLEVIPAGGTLLVSGRLLVAPAPEDLASLHAEARARFGEGARVAVEPSADLALELFRGTVPVWHRPAAGGGFAAPLPLQFTLPHPGDTRPVELLLRGRIFHETLAPALDLAVRVDGAAFLAALTAEAALDPAFPPERFARAVARARLDGAIKFKGDPALALDAAGGITAPLLSRLVDRLAPLALEPDPLPPDPAEPFTPRRRIRAHLAATSFQMDFHLRTAERVRREHPFHSILSFVPPDPAIPGDAPPAPGGDAPAPGMPPEVGAPDRPAPGGDAADPEARKEALRERIGALARDIALYRKLAASAADPERKRSAAARADALAKERADLLDQLRALRDRPHEPK